MLLSSTRLHLFLLALLLPTLALAQEKKCGTVPYQAQPQQRQFEQWMDREILQKRQSLLFSKTSEDEIYRIPVVVHVVHRGEPEGVGSNIPLEQIENQIRILNEDFRRQNPDTIFTPAEFLPVAADAGIEFVLAKQDPNGAATNGVVRVRGSQNVYDIADGNILSNDSYWDSERYLNIWVAPLGSSYFGFAQFPVSDLPGLENSSRNAETDGVVIDYRYFGSGGNALERSLGRTATHEIGHFLGLRHIWGDGDCSADDFVDDTPRQESETPPSTCEERFTCGNLNMIQNYMDYTDDVCMNIFTEDQKLRMRVVLESSERRASLLVSPGLAEPNPIPNDASISRIIAPRTRECAAVIVPTIELFNPGTNAINTVTIAVSVEGSRVEQVVFEPNLAVGSAATLAFSPLNLGPNNLSTPYEVAFIVTQVNGTTDENFFNNRREVTFIVSQQAALPLADDFESSEDTPFSGKSIIRNPDEQITWEPVAVPGFAGQDNRALYLNFFDYESVGERDYLYTPTFSTENFSSATLSFRVSYARYLDGDSTVREDGLIVGISTDCGATLDTVLYEKFGEDLETQPLQNDPFVPTSRAMWRLETIDLDDYLDESGLQIVFIGVNEYGNNLYLDDITISGPEVRELDLSLARLSTPVNNAIAPSSVIAPSLLSCNTSPVPQMVIRNAGFTPISSFNVTYQLDSQSPTSFTYNAFPLEPTETFELTFEQTDLSLGLHRFSVSVTQPNARLDDRPEDNQVAANFYVDAQQDIIPLINSFEAGAIPDVLSGQTPTALTDWLVVNPDSSITWQKAAVASADPSVDSATNMSAFIRLNDYQAIGQSDLLVSPTLDFSELEEASMRFQVSYATFSDEFVDTLRVLVSTDCGQTYEVVRELENTISIKDTAAAWVPRSADDWREEVINLSQYAGESDVRVAFEAVNGYGNNLYLDDVEFFTSETPIRPQENAFVIAPNPTENQQLNVAFNLRQREDITIAIYNLQGVLINEFTVVNVLNQTYTIDMSGRPLGVYILRVFSSTLNDSQKFILR